MSYDVSLGNTACAHCGHEPTNIYAFNLTHNVNGIVDACLSPGFAVNGASFPAGATSWGRLHGRRAEEAIAIIERALTEATDPERTLSFRAMEPSNEWGSLENVQECLRSLLDACREHPNAIISACG